MANFPNVPQLPGVPAVPRSPSFPTATAPVIATASLGLKIWDQINPNPQWGIFYTNLKPALTADSVLTFGNRNEYAVMDFPVQSGGFSSYNKVANPYDITLRLMKSGSKAERAIFLRTLDLIISSLELYTILTPERSYVGVNMLRYDVVRDGAKDAFALTGVDVYFREIRQVDSQYTTTEAATANTSNARLASATPSVNSGVAKVQDASSAVSNSVTTALSQGSP